MLCEHGGNGASTDREIALEISIAGIGLGKPLANGKAVLENSQRFGEVASCRKRIAELVVCNGEIALPVGIYGVGLGQAVGNSQSLPVQFKSLGEIAFEP